MKILIVDDKIENLIALETVLEDLEDIEFVRALSGMEALEQLLKHEFALILIDVQMPEMDGFEATAEIREKEKETGGHIPIIAMTAHAMKGDRERCLEAGMDEYVSKPIRPQTVVDAIETVTED